MSFLVELQPPFWIKYDIVCEIVDWKMKKQKNGKINAFWKSASIF